MRVELIEGISAFKLFTEVKSNVYKGNKYYRGTTDSIEEMLLSNSSKFCKHSISKFFIVSDGNNPVARFALIKDFKSPEYIQVSFFEALPGLGDLFKLIKETILIHFPNSTKVVVGINGHIHYGVGFLLNNFNQPPLFGLPYNPPYYEKYFAGLHCHRMVSFRYSIEKYNDWAKNFSYHRGLENVEFRVMDKRRLKDEIVNITRINNQSFSEHLFWSDRDEDEDQEIFYPFRHLLEKENILFAEVNGKPIGFCLWYPDFNELISSNRNLNIFDLIKFKLLNGIKTTVFNEIAIIPEYRKGAIPISLSNKALLLMLNKGYKYLEGGFIFEENKASMAQAKRVAQRCGESTEPYRQFAIYEANF